MNLQQPHRFRIVCEPKWKPNRRKRKIRDSRKLLLLHRAIVTRRRWWWLRQRLRWLYALCLCFRIKCLCALVSYAFFFLLIYDLIFNNFFSLFLAIISSQCTRKWIHKMPNECKLPSKWKKKNEYIMLLLPLQLRLWSLTVFIWFCAPCIQRYLKDSRTFARTKDENREAKRKIEFFFFSCRMPNDVDLRASALARRIRVISNGTPHNKYIEILCRGSVFIFRFVFCSMKMETLRRNEKELFIFLEER